MSSTSNAPADARSTKPGRYEYLVTIPDVANGLEARIAARPQHLELLKPHLESGKIVFGGAMLGKDPEDGKTPDMKGSVMLLKADSVEDARKWVEGDVYSTSGVWDAKNVQVQPFKCAVRTAL